VALAVAGGCAATIALLHTAAGLRAIAATANRLAPATLRIDAPRGTLADDFGAARVFVDLPSMRVEIDDLEARTGATTWRPAAIRLISLRARRVSVLVHSPASSDMEPASVALPVEIEAGTLAIGRLEVATGGATEAPLVLDRLAGHVLAGRDGIRVDAGRVAWGGVEATVDGSLDARAPYAVAASLTLAAPLRSHDVHADVRASGSLDDLRVAAAFAGGGARGGVDVRLAPRHAQPWRSIRVDLAAFDPADWWRGAPHASLDVDAELSMAAMPGEAAATAATLRGPLRLKNRAPGPFDRDRLPVRALAAAATLAAGPGAAGVTARLDGIDAEIGSAATLRGRLAGTLAYAAGVPTPLEAALVAQDVDLSALDSRLAALPTRGRVVLRQDGDHLAAEADLSARDARLALRLQADAVALRIDRARMLLGSGTLDAAGSWRYADRHLALTATAHALDASRLVPGIHSDLGGRLELDGSFRGMPKGRLDLELEPSRVCVRAASCVELSGHARGESDPDGLATVDADLHAGSATLSAHGSTRWPTPVPPGDPTPAAAAPPLATVDLAIDVPALQDFAPALKGRARAQAVLEGTLPRPRLVASITADDIALEGRSIRHAEIRIAQDAGPVGSTHARIEAADRGWTLSAAADGRLDLGAEPIGSTAWHGELARLELSGAYPIRLAAPASLSIDRGGWAVGPATLDALGGHFDGVEFAAGSAGLHSEGSFRDVKPRIDMSDAAAAPDGGGDPPNLAVTRGYSDLALAGRWNLQLGASTDQAGGSIDIERTSGDLYAGRLDAASALGLRDLRLHADLHSGDLQVTGTADSERAGNVRLDGHAALAHGPGATDWHVAMDRPFAWHATADLPALEALAPLTSSRVHANVRVAGRLAAQVQIDGTPAEPRARGDIDGRDLRVAWIDQGVRLDGGTLRARFEGSTLQVDELRFVSPVRVHPVDRRAEAAIVHEEAGYVAASGRYDLRSGAGLLQVEARHLPLLQRPDRWVVASGGANVALTRERVRLEGAVAADAGSIDFSRADLPSLSSDVEVASGAARPAAPPPRLAVGFDVAIDLGPAFYLRGRGLQARAEGALRLRSDGGDVIRATGSVAAEDGTFEGFGQKLQIERGRVTFQGPLDNPGLDILALRRGLPVTVGVTIGRTAADPLIRLYSDPPLPDYEAMSWLALGRAPDQGGSDTVAIATAAAGLLGGAGEGLPTRLARQLGIDQVNVTSADASSTPSLLPRQSVAGPLRGDATTTTATTQIVSLGKRVNDVLTVSYEQGISGVASVVQVSYQLSRRLSLLARAGTENALDLVLTLSFD